MKIVNQIITVMLASLIFSCSSEDPKDVTDLPSVAVKVTKAVAGGDANSITASGKTEAKNSANLSTRMMGSVTKLNVKVGERIRKGQQLLVINNSDLVAKRSQVEASIAQVTSAMKNAEKDYERFKTLHEKESASEKELDDMTTRYEMAKANLKAAQQMKNEIQAQFAYTNIKAPFDGVVINAFVKVGDMASPGVPLISVEGTNSFQSVVLVAESDITKIKVNMDAKVQVKSTNKEFSGKVVEVSPSAKNTGGQYMVKIDIVNVDESVLPGMFVNVQFDAVESDVPKNVLVPSEALIRQGQLTGIYTLGNDQTAILRWLRIGKEYDGKVEVLSGLQADELFIVSSEGKLFNGAKVTL
ncbi:MAG: efflux RND transporter periplasmic adaptor subunit [Cyclobacteriaceae bacterium]